MATQRKLQTQEIKVSSDPTSELGIVRQIVLQIGGDSLENAADEVLLGLRALDHRPAPTTSSLSDLQAIDDQLRFYTSERCLRQFRAVGKFLRHRHEGTTFSVISQTPPTPGDWQFLRLLATFIDLHITVENPDLPSGWLPEHGDLDIDKCLNSGDSWTAAKIADHLIERCTSEELAALPIDSIALAYGMQGRAGESFLAFESWGRRGGLDAARARYSLALLLARHFPEPYRDLERAGRLLDEAWGLLRSEPVSEQRDYERIFNRNGRALILYRAGRYRDAERMLSVGLAKLRTTKHAGTVHETVLVNNLGRVHDRAGNHEQARKWLTEATRLDPRFAEYWYDVALHHYRLGNLSEAVGFATNAHQLNPTYPEHATLVGNVLFTLDQHDEARGFFEDALSYDPEFSAALLGLSRISAIADDYSSCMATLSRVRNNDLAGADGVTAELLRIECELNLELTTFEQAHEALLALGVSFPDSAPVQESIEMFASLISSPG